MVGVNLVEQESIAAPIGRSVRNERTMLVNIQLLSDVVPGPDPISKRRTKAAEAN